MNPEPLNAYTERRRDGSDGERIICRLGRGHSLAWRNKSPCGNQPPVPPIQLDLFTGEPRFLPIVVNRDVDEELRVSEDIMLARSGDAAQLILSGFGLSMGKKGDRLIIRKGKNLLYEFPFFRLSEVTVASKGISLSSDAILELCQRGVQINFMQGTGRPFAKLSSPMLSATGYRRPGHSIHVSFSIHLCESFRGPG